MRRRIRSAAFPVHRHSLPQLLVDGILVALAYFLAYRLRFDVAAVPSRYEELFESTVWWVVPVSLAALAAFGLYQRVWTFVGQREYEAVIKGVIVATLVVVGAISLLHPVQTPPTFVFKHNVLHQESNAVTLPASVIALFVLLSLALLVAARFIVHVVVEGRTRSFRSAKGAREVLVVGGGDGGRLVVRELARNPQLGLRPVGFVDDDPRKQGFKDEYGLRVLGTTASEELARILDEVEPDEVVIAIPSAPGTLRARVVAACRDRGIPVRTTPTVFELLRDGSGRLEVTRQLREVQVEDILGREPVRMEVERVGAYLAEEVVLVTGAGGSIGGELCRQIARVGPRRLVLVDHAEDNLFEIVRELEEDRHVRTAVPVLADCKERERMREVLEEHRPAVVFHAAAYKHVTMMELNPVEAIRNNALATQLMARLAGETGVATFVLVSTDKAVKPATVMGASKALAEWAVEAAAARHPQTSYATVRFGNVLGSSGSVVPIFRRQIAAGGPVTVTDARMKRYFMTIPEAVQLIIRAGSLGGQAAPASGQSPTAAGGELFVLEMGDAVDIVELAETMIRLSGLEPERDIAIEIVGARPGEKLHEDLFNPYERPQPTPAQKIVRAQRDALDPAWVEQTFTDINLLVLEGDAAALAQRVSKLARTRLAAGDLDARLAT
jgi:FlaA1/EpsC-like NDP-sugar epimerase